MAASPARSPQASLPQTLGELRHSHWSQKRLRDRGVQDELRENLIARLRSDSTEPLFPGILGYEDTVVPQIIHAVLARHNFILLGLRGQAKSRILRSLTALLDPEMPYIAGCEIRDNPYNPLCRRCKDLIAQMEESTPIAWLAPADRYVEKLATPDVTVADLIGDVDPIRAARGGHDLSSELTMHYGLLPRANRGIFAINELPDLAGKIQVALFNILEEGDVQLKGYPVRLALDVALVFSANPEDYTARGKIVTPLKDRIGSEIRTHYPQTLAEGIAITQQETWSDRGILTLETPDYLREIVEQLAFSAREDKKVDKRSGVSQRLPIAAMELVLSSAERRALINKEDTAVPRIADLYAAIPGITGKLELEYEGEMRGPAVVVNDLIRAAILSVYDKYFADENTQQIEQWFHLGGNIKLDDTMSSTDALAALSEIQGLREKLGRVGIRSKDNAPRAVAAAEFLLEGLAAHKKIGRNEERAFTAPEKTQRPREPQRADESADWEPSNQRRPRRNYN
jgi:magnesium chelatase subunit I